MIVSRSRPPAAALHVAEALGAELVEMGSAANHGGRAVNARSTPTPAASTSGTVRAFVAAAAGCHVSRIDGSPLRYNQRSVFARSSGRRPELADATAALAGFDG